MKHHFKANPKYCTLVIRRAAHSHFEIQSQVLFSNTDIGLATNLPDFPPLIWPIGILPSEVSFQNKADLSTRASECLL